MKTRRLVMLSLIALFVSTSSLQAATVNGAKIHSTLTGQGRTIIFVHRWTCEETSWSEQIPVLSRKYRVITIDLPGHGQSDPPKAGKFSMDVFANAIQAAWAEANVYRVILAGHSMGGPVVYRYAQLHRSTPWPSSLSTPRFSKVLTSGPSSIRHFPASSVRTA